MFRFNQSFFQQNIPQKKLFPQFWGYAKFLGIVFLMQCVMHSAAAQGSINQMEVLGGVVPVLPATEGDEMLPPIGINADVQSLNADDALVIVNLPFADYTGNFEADVEKYKSVVIRWASENPSALSQQDGITQNLINMGYYATLFKWQVQNNRINKISTK